jgi:hypothetical protein
MKKLHATLAILFLSNHALYTSNYMQEKVIAHKAVLIKKMITKHDYAVSGLMALGYLQQLSYWLPTLFTGAHYFFGEPNSINTTIAPICVCASQQREKVKELGFFAGITKDFEDLFGTVDGWKRIGGGGLHIVGYIGAFFLFQKISDSVYHPDTLRWYIKAQIPYENTTIMIEDVAQRLTTADYNDQKRIQHYQFVLRNLCKQLVGYSEDICAYMIYKSNNVPENQKIFAEGVSRYLFNYQNDILATIFNELAEDAPEYNKIINIIKAYRVEMIYQRKLFSSIESETKEELRRIQKSY